MKKTTQEVIERIHHEFNTAGDDILREATKIIDEGLLNKATRLEAAGFVISREVKKAAHMKITKDIADCVVRYQVRYPDNKFITEEQVKTINKKYNLVCAPISKYKGFVPEIKLSQIEKFKVNAEDKEIDAVRLTNCWNNFMGNLPFALRLKAANLVHKRIGLEIIPLDHPLLNTNQGRLFSIGEAYIERYNLIDRASVKICAPIRDFDTKGMSKFGSMFYGFTTHHIPDPVVLQPVKGGFLIVAAWGDEASDEIVVNQKMN